VRVLIVNADLGGCGFYRLLAPAHALQSMEPDIEVALDENGASILCGWADGHVISVAPLDYDVVIFQRPLDQHIVEAIPFIQANGSAVVVEFDDDFWNIDRQNVAYLHPTNPSTRSPAHLARACSLADLVTVSTPTLAQETPAARGRVRVLPNYVPESYLTTEVSPGDAWALMEGRTIVGWTGNPATHPRDLETVGDAVVRAVRGDESAVFFTIGSQATGRMLGFDAGESAYSPPIQLENYPAVVAGLDIGLVPLRLNAFNESKSWLKGLEYAALGVPFIASPTQQYESLSRLGAGLLAQYPHQWHRHLSALLASRDLREQTRGHGREIAASLTYEKQAHRWASAWEQAVKNHHQQRSSNK
jgi:hypothetical protein